MLITEEIKAKILAVPILSVARALGIQITNRRTALCFMHDDHRPSLGFKVSNNTWKCFVCNKGGNQITLVMEKLNLPYVDACKWLADSFGIHIPSDNGFRRRITRPIRHATKKEEKKVSPIDKEVALWIIEHAGLSELANDFLFIQRKYSEDVVNYLNIGSISDSTRLVNNLVNTFGKERMLASGVVRQNSKGLYLFFYTPCLIFPYTDIDGCIVNIQTRYLGTNTNAPRFQFLPGSVIGIFNMPILKCTSRTERLYVTEGVTDCIAHLSSGHKAVAIPSATSLKKEDVKVLASKNLFMYPDADEPGEKLFNQLHELLHDNYSTISRLQLPDGYKDYSDYYKKIIENGRLPK